MIILTIKKFAVLQSNADSSLSGVFFGGGLNGTAASSSALMSDVGLMWILHLFRSFYLILLVKIIISSCFNLCRFFLSYFGAVVLSFLFCPCLYVQFFCVYSCSGRPPCSVGPKSTLS